MIESSTSEHGKHAEEMFQEIANTMMEARAERITFEFGPDRILRVRLDSGVHKTIAKVIGQSKGRTLKSIIQHHLEYVNSRENP